MGEKLLEYIFKQMVSKKKGIPIVELKEAFRASEDFGRYTKTRRKVLSVI